MDREAEIRLQFLDEADEYLNALETTLLGIAQRGIEIHQMNTALRAAHSIKGGAALMGYILTSDLAHRLEDALKVLKLQRSEEVTGDIEGQMLSAVDAIRQIVERDRRTALLASDPLASDPPVSDQLERQIMPIFEALYDTLGEPSAEDAASILDADESQDVTPLIFQAEINGLLERLDSLLADHSPQLQAEVVVMAQELSALGKMLDLPLFVQFCQSVKTYAVAAKDTQQIEEVSQAALTSWKRAQALVLTGNAESMPRQLTGISFRITDSDSERESAEAPTSIETKSLSLTGYDAGLGTGFGADLGAENDALVSNIFANLSIENEASAGDVFADLGTESNVPTGDDLAEQAVLGTDLETNLGAGLGSSLDIGLGADYGADYAGNGELEVDAFAGVFEQIEQPLDELGGEQPGQSEAAFRLPASVSKSQGDESELTDNTVRVSVRKLNELNDDLGELTIEHNRLEAEVKRLRSLVKNLSQRLRSLDEINEDVKDLYEQAESERLSTRPQRTLPQAAGSQALANTTNGLTRTSAFEVSDTQASNSAADDTDAIDSGFRQNFDLLELDRYSDTHLTFRQIAESVVRLQEVADDLELSTDQTEQTTRAMRRTNGRLQRNLNQLRMRPLADITNRFPRALRELEIEHGKLVQLQLEGEHTLIDRNILEALSDPLMHIVRNAFDHGIESPESRERQGKSSTGTIAIRAANKNNRTLITVSDDGQGIAIEKIRDRAQSMGLDAELLSAASKNELLSLIFEPGFSTSNQVTALSGRGVGMDIVRSNLTQIRGDISVDTKAGEGTTFTLSVPYTLSITRVILVEGNRMPIAVPTDRIEAVTALDPSDIRRADGKELLAFKGSSVRLIRLSNWLAFNCPRQVDSLETKPRINTPSVLIFRMGEQRLGLQIDRYWNEQEVVIRRVEGPVTLPTGFSNCTILENGKVVPIISLTNFARWIIGCETSGIHSAKALYSNPILTGAIASARLQAASNKEAHRRARFLVIDDSVNVRRLLALTLEKAGYEVVQARDGQDAFEKLETDLVIDSIVCDIEMPKMDGYSFLSKLRAKTEYAQIPVTMLTSRSSDKHRDLAMNLGATAYFSKPYQERTLLRSLAASLEETKSSRL
ncbi:ATPase, histidine kinase-, DNA gyrase B-, and HSP90-like domain protein [Synechococcus sp. PCC 7335]|uniref:hybrid sensor histidine kinase/response regulator n=1 Tax=Synechococcus sp. (strain ATCC 29403 / PCC 7335) TaxID=91464 RepID=UPI00017EC398|nr:response regulator [Synechococcus sp. PCC 7335]EDX84444.1 ATPase, histidine kinase-, DNA gyrase B-, and HSP90-like domain protein [Synechococcus sp. PCC 7335]